MIRPLTGYVVNPTAADRVVAPVTEILSREEREHILATNPDTSLHLVTEVPEARTRGRRYLERVTSDGTFLPDEGWWVYRITDNGHSQTGVIAEVAVAAYEAGRIRRHEHTVAEVADHVADTLEEIGASTHPVSLIYRSASSIENIVSEVADGLPTIRVERSGRLQEAWKVEQSETLAEALDAIPVLYIADGHHRSAAAAVLAGRKNSEARSHLLAVLFPDVDMKILSYHRCLHLLDHSPAEILEAIGRHFPLRPIQSPSGTPDPDEVWVCGERSWYALQLTRGIDEGPTSALDAARLQHQILGPICDVADPRADPRLNYMPGNVPLTAVASECDAQAGLSFVTRPPTVDEIIAVSDAGGVVPPKSTWFAPKIGAGMFLRTL